MVWRGERIEGEDSEGSVEDEGAEEGNQQRKEWQEMERGGQGRESVSTYALQ